jgi:hypothetical protein
LSDLKQNENGPLQVEEEKEAKKKVVKIDLALNSD